MLLVVCLVRVGHGRNLEVCRHGRRPQWLYVKLLHFTQDSNESSDMFTSFIVSKMLFS